MATSSHPPPSLLHLRVGSLTLPFSPRGPASGSDSSPPALGPTRPWSPNLLQGHCQPLYQPLADKRQQCPLGHSSPWLRVPGAQDGAALCPTYPPPNLPGSCLQRTRLLLHQEYSPWCEGSESPELVPAFSISGDQDASSCHVSPSPCQTRVPPPPVPPGTCLLGTAPPVSTVAFPGDLGARPGFGLIFLQGLCLVHSRHPQGSLGEAALGASKIPLHTGHHSSRAGLAPGSQLPAQPHSWVSS